MNVGERTEELIHVQFNLQHRHWLLEFRIVTTGTIDSLWDVLEDEVEVNFVFLGSGLEQCERVDAEKISPPSLHWSKKRHEDRQHWDARRVS